MDRDMDVKIMAVQVEKKQVIAVGLASSLPPTIITCLHIDSLLNHFNLTFFFFPMSY